MQRPNPQVNAERVALSNPMQALSALALLREGNARFVKNEVRSDLRVRPDMNPSLLERQSPFAIVLACSDSRVPAEYVFDCGFGDLFMIRVAGNVVAPSLVGSIEFAAAKFGTELVVVMGHTRCGAIDATLNVVRKQNEPMSDNLRDIVDRVAPSVTELVGLGLTEEELARAATRANVRASASQLRHASRLIESRVASGRLTIVGGVYELETGVVDFFDRPESVGEIESASPSSSRSP